jgi:cobalt-zinc-cadmium efflux system protein
MGAGHDHTRPTAPAPPGYERRMLYALILTATYMVAEVVGGLLTGSLALLSDAAHMLTDVAGLAIALAAMRLARRPADARRTYGYHRFEILAAAFNAVVLFGVALYILYEAYRRFTGPPPEVHSVAMLIVAAIGLAVNLVSMRLLRSGKDASLNVKGAYLEVWSDMLGSVAVMAAAGIIRLTGWWPVDPILAVLIGLWVLPRTWTLLSQSVNLLLEGVPEGVEFDRLTKELADIEGVASLHDLHVWAVTSQKNLLSVHLVLRDDVDASWASVSRIIAEAGRIAGEHKINHATVQVDPPGAKEHGLGY